MHLFFQQNTVPQKCLKLNKILFKKFFIYLCNFNALEDFNEENFVECKVCDYVFREFAHEKCKFSEKVCLVKQLERFVLNVLYVFV